MQAYYLTDIAEINPLGIEIGTRTTRRFSIFDGIEAIELDTQSYLYVTAIVFTLSAILNHQKKLVCFIQREFILVCIIIQRWDVLKHTGMNNSLKTHYLLSLPSLM